MSCYLSQYNLMRVALKKQFYQLSFYSRTEQKPGIDLLQIRSMMVARDDNGSRLLTLLTGELLNGGAVLETCIFKSSYFNLWDDIGG